MPLTYLCVTPAQHFRTPDGAQEAVTQMIGTLFLNMGYKRLNTIPKKKRSCLKGVAFFKVNK